jgi:phospho-N-acetylmuramoyl-pentapeptide-transferase
MGGVLVAEALSVMLQVGYFQYTKTQNRHRPTAVAHVALAPPSGAGGWSEVQVVGSLYGITALLVGLGWAWWHWTGM